MSEDATTWVEWPWAKWPWQQCPAATIDGYGRCRCELRRKHHCDHRAERGMYDVVWSHEYRMEGHES